MPATRSRAQQEEPPWTLERVVAELRALHAIGELVSGNALVISGRRDLVQAATRYAGSWSNALRLAGVQDAWSRKAWTRERVVREIVEMHGRGASLMSNDVPNNLKIAAQRLFGGWRAARSVALPDFDAPYERWTRSAILERLRARRARGESLVTSEVRAGEEARLVNAAIRELGSWDAALHAAFDDHVSRRSWDRASIVLALRRRHRERRSLNAAIVARDDPGLLAAAREHYGRWRYALEAAHALTAVNREAWTPDGILVRLRELAVTHGRVTAKVAGPTLTSACQRYFGSFSAACIAAKVDRQR